MPAMLDNQEAHWEAENQHKWLACPGSLSTNVGCKTPEALVYKQG